MTLVQKMNSISYQILLRTFPELTPGTADDYRPRQNAFPKIGKYALRMAIVMLYIFKKRSAFKALRTKSVMLKVVKFTNSTHMN